MPRCSQRSFLNGSEGRRHPQTERAETWMMQYFRRGREGAASDAATLWVHHGNGENGDGEVQAEGWGE